MGTLHLALWEQNVKGEILKYRLQTLLYFAAIISFLCIKKGNAFFFVQWVICFFNDDLKVFFKRVK